MEARVEAGLSRGKMTWALTELGVPRAEAVELISGAVMCPGQESMVIVSQGLKRTED